MARFLFSIILIHLCLCYVLVSQIGAADNGVTASAFYRGTYDDNLFFRGVSDFVHLVTPSLAVGRVTEQSEIQVAADLDFFFYDKFDQLNTVDQFYQLLGGVSASPRLRLDLIGTYVKDTTFASALEQTGIVTDRNDRTTGTINPMVTFGWTARDRSQLSYVFNSTQYEGDRFRDYLLHDLGLDWIHDLKNERTSIVFLAGGNQTKYSGLPSDDFSDLIQRTLRVLIGFDHLLSETATVRLRAGTRYTDTEFLDSNREDKESTGFLGDFELAWRSERAQILLGVNQNFVPSTLGENVNRTRVDLALGYSLTERLDCRLSGNYRYSDTDNAEEPTRDQAYAIRPRIIYQLPWNMDLRLAYSYTWAENIITDETDERQRVFLELRWEIHRPEWRIRRPRPLVKWQWR